MITVCVWLLIKAGKACKLRGSHVLGVGLRYWGAGGYSPRPHGEHSCRPQHVGEHRIAHTGLQVTPLGRRSELDLEHLRLLRWVSHPSPSAQCSSAGCAG